MSILYINEYVPVSHVARIWIKDGFFYYDVDNPQLHLRWKISDRILKILSVVDYVPKEQYLVLNVEHDTLGVVEEYFDIANALNRMGLSIEDLHEIEEVCIWA